MYVYKPPLSNLRFLERLPLHFYSLNKPIIIKLNTLAHKFKYVLDIVSCYEILYVYTVSCEVNMPRTADIHAAFVAVI